MYKDLNNYLLKNDLSNKIKYFITKIIKLI